MELKKLFDEIRSSRVPCAYWLEGEEYFFIDEFVRFFETGLLDNKQKHFDLSVFYGGNSTFDQVLCSCIRAPLLSDFVVVILKEAQSFKDIKKIENYLLKYSSACFFVVAFKGKGLDARTSLSKVVKEKAKFFKFNCLKEADLVDFIDSYVKNAGFKIKTNTVRFLVDHVGSNLSVIVSELCKIFVNYNKGEEIKTDDIADFIGVSREYNIFELQNALGAKNKKKIITIMSYMINNPRANPFLQINIMLYRFFAKLLLCLDNQTIPDRELAPLLGLHTFFLKDFKNSSKNYTKDEIEKNILVLFEYNLKAVGITNSSMEESDLKKEMIMKILLD